MKNKNWQPKYKASAASAGRDEQSRVTSPSLSKLSEKEMERVVGGLLGLLEAEFVGMFGGEDNDTLSGSGGDD